MISTEYLLPLSKSDVLIKFKRSPSRSELNALIDFLRYAKKQFEVKLAETDTTTLNRTKS